MSCLIVALALARSSNAWYGPVTVTAPIAFTGNPYDGDENDVDVDFESSTGVKLRRLAYYVGDGKFASTLVAPAPGTYTAHFLRNGKEVVVLPQPVTIDAKLPHGFIGLKGRHFAWSDGTPYFPLGYDYAWRSIPNESVAQGMTKMGKSGANWSRIWANHWDGKNPFWPEIVGRTTGPQIPGRELRQAPLETWDGIVRAAEDAGVSFQMVLFHHGPYSTTTDSNWAEHPWNTKNGGFLADPTDFFIDPEAKHRSKIWLRNAVARYAHSPAIMSWELFNEVQWVDAIKKNPKRVGDVAAWHKEMAAYVRSLDPYHHLLTSSSSESLDSGVFDSVDYMQPHTYPANVLASIGGYEFKRKPGFFGEFGPPGGARSNLRKSVRDGIYGGMLAGQAGAGEYWFWDQVDRGGLAADYLAARKVIDQSGLLTHLRAKPFSIAVQTPKRTDLQIAAGLGWAKSTVSELDLPNVDVRALGGWSQYFQSLDGGQKAWAKPLIVRFDAKAAGKLLLNVGQVSPKGATLTVWVNDRQAFDQKFDAVADGARPAGGRGGRAPVSVDYPAGPVVVRIENHGADWVRLDSITVPDIGATAMAHGMGDGGWALIRVVGSDTSSVSLSGLKLRDGSYTAKIFNAATGEVTESPIVVQSGGATLTNLPPDGIIDFSK